MNVFLEKIKNNSKTPEIRKYIPHYLAVILLLIIAFFIGKSFNNTPVTDPQIASLAIRKQQTINKTFQFPVKDDKGNEITKINYTIESVTTQTQVIIKGQFATAIKGKEFLIVNLKMGNTSDSIVQINSRDYIRVSVNHNSDFLAADIHNDPVQIQPISTKYTSIGFPINDTDKNITLHIGEIDGKKVVVPIFSSH